MVKITLILAAFAFTACASAPTGDPVALAVHECAESLAVASPEPTSEHCKCLAAHEPKALAEIAQGAEPQHTRSGVERQDHADWIGHGLTHERKYREMLARCR